MRRVLILFAHPAFERSRVQRRLLQAIQDLTNVTIHDLYEAYPTFDIDIDYEQQLLLEHDLIVFQHPFFWYSVPAIIKQWEDLVLEHGWAYGSQGNALQGKFVLNAISTGGAATAYRREGLNRHTIRELLAPIEQTVTLCKMTYLPPFVVHGTHLIDEAGIAAAAETYRRIMIGLRDNQIDLEAAQRHTLINADPAAILAVEEVRG
jgi:glutathione-regulated potassium-efflux system ancillary protein KefG